MIYNFRNQNSCSNCHHHFYKYEYDDDPSFYCLLKNSDTKRPLCGSVAMKEDYGHTKHKFKDNEEYWVEHDKWDAWEKENKVEDYSICSCWQLKEGMIDRHIENANNLSEHSYSCNKCGKVSFWCVCKGENENN